MNFRQATVDQFFHCGLPRIKGSYLCLDLICSDSDWVLECLKTSAEISLSTFFSVRDSHPFRVWPN
jgi:hypothetical protein